MRVTESVPFKGYLKRPLTEVHKGTFNHLRVTIAGTTVVPLMVISRVSLRVTLRGTAWVHYSGFGMYTMKPRTWTLDVLKIQESRIEPRMRKGIGGPRYQHNRLQHQLEDLGPIKEHGIRIMCGLGFRLLLPDQDDRNQEQPKQAMFKDKHQQQPWFGSKMRR